MPALENLISKYNPLTRDCLYLRGEGYYRWASIDGHGFCLVRFIYNDSPKHIYLDNIWGKNENNNSV